MICPKCGYTESNHVETKSDKEKYLDFWGFQMGTPEAEEAWKQKEEMTADGVARFLLLKTILIL